MVSPADGIDKARQKGGVWRSYNFESRNNGSVKMTIPFSCHTR